MIAVIITGSKGSHIVVKESRRIYSSIELYKNGIVGPFIQELGYKTYREAVQTLKKYYKVKKRKSVSISVEFQIIERKI